MSNRHLRKSILTFTFAVVVLVLTVPKHLGMFLLLFAPFIAVAVIYNAVAAALIPENRKMHLTRVFVWILVVSISGLAQWYWFEATRSTANAIVSAVTDYKSRTGAWPSSLQDVGMQVSNSDFREPYGYDLRNGEPSLAYLATDTIFDTYEYDFKSKKWVYFSH